MTSKLSTSDPHYWAPIDQLVQWLADRIPQGARVLEVGPGHEPFPKADTFVDFVDLPGVKVVKCDLTRERLPFDDKTFDFVYCRHLLEDSWNPFAVCAEISRVGKAGYIETPSPVAEMGRGVDGSAPHYRGYHHHRWMIWSHQGGLKFLTKYPLVEYLGFDEAFVVKLLRDGPLYWNTYHLWNDEIRVNHVQSPLNYDIPTQYGTVIASAMSESIAATNEFWSQIQPAKRVA